MKQKKAQRNICFHSYKTENGEIAVGGDVNSFMNVIKNIQSDIEDKYTADDVRSNEPQNNDSVTENDNTAQNDNRNRAKRNSIPRAYLMIMLYQRLHLHH